MVHHQRPHSGPKCGQWASITELLPEARKLSPSRAHTGRAPALPVPECLAMGLSSGDTTQQKNTKHMKVHQPAPALRKETVSTSPLPVASRWLCSGQGDLLHRQETGGKGGLPGAQGQAWKCSREVRGLGSHCPYSTFSGRGTVLLVVFFPSYLCSS